MTLWLLLACRPPTAPTAPAAPTPGATTAWLATTSATELADRLAAGSLTAADLDTATRARIAELDRQGPALHALIAVAPPSLGGSGRLAGLPLAVKDNIDVAGMPTTAGSLALAGHVPVDDAFVVARVRAAGAVVIGKANLSEWANFRGLGSVSGWSAVGGQTHNPYALDHNPCGSSSGSAVAVAAGLAAFAIGTETDGSILCPASVNGIVGVKPTQGLVSRDGIVPIAHSLDTAGPMARTVADAAMLLEAMASADPTDPAAANRPADLDTHYVANLRPDALKGARIGVGRHLATFDPATAAVFDAAVADLVRLGAVIIDPIPLALSPEVDALEREVMVHEFGPDLAAYLATVDPARGLHHISDVVAFNTAHPEELRWFGQEWLEEAAAHPRDDAYVARLAELRRRTGPEGLDAALAAGKLDAVVTPTFGPAWVTDADQGDPNTLWGTSTLTAVSGCPAITVPMGHVDGLPVGLSFLGAAFDETDLLSYALAYEQGTQHRTPPRFLGPSDPKPATP